MNSQVATITLGTVQAPIQHRLPQVQAELRRIVEADFALIADVNAHLFQMQGKLFRPTLTLLTDAATGGPDPRAVTLAATIELIHLATLVHDDSVDHSVLRRGMPTINSLFSHQISVIMGDYLYSRAVIELVNLSDLDALRVLSRVTNEMTVGEMRQLLSHDRLQFTEEQYDLLISAKTASLISGACEVGALRATPEVRAALGRFGQALGMAFQMVDDLLDYTEDSGTTGKPAGLDLKEHKVTLPLIETLRRVSPEQRAVVERLFAMPEPGDSDIARVVEIVRETGGLDFARRRGEEYASQAEEALYDLPNSPARAALNDALAYVLDRRF